MRRLRISLVFVIAAFLAMIGANPALAADAPAEILVERSPGQPGSLTLENRTIELETGKTAEVEAGTLLVPETRGRPGSPVISIPFYRLRSTAAEPEPPIFLLAGGPGASWIDRFRHEENHREVERYRTIADVVLFDQRGGGHSLPRMDCEAERGQLPADKPVSSARRAEELRRLARDCRDRWLEAGVDLAAYNTRENVSDVLALQEALGYPKVSLVGGSYGSHLALALMRRAPARIHRAILYGVEGPDHTWDDPGGRLAALERIAGTAEADPTLGPHIPDGGLLGALEAVIARLEKEPKAVTVSRGDQTVSVVVDATAVRQFAAIQAGRRSRPNAWPEFVLDLLHGDYSHIAHGALALRELRLDDPMHYMMDCASGISPTRAERYRRHPARKILGDINFEYRHLCDIWLEAGGDAEEADLGAGFRAPVTVDVPTLLIHGTWDTSTPIGNAREVAAALPRSHLLEVITGNHGALYNLYSHWPPAWDMVRRFLSGEVSRLPTSVTLPPVKFAPRSH